MSKEFYLTPKEVERIASTPPEDCWICNELKDHYFNRDTRHRTFLIIDEVNEEFIDHLEQRLGRRINTFYDSIKFRKLYKRENEGKYEDLSKGDCPTCKKGHLNVSLDYSFIIEIKRRLQGIIKDTQEFEFDVIECDRCKYIRIEQVKEVSED